MCNNQELKGNNISAAKGKGVVDPFRISLIKKYVFDMFSIAPNEQYVSWKKCVKSMDEFIRIKRIKRSF